MIIDLRPAVDYLNKQICPVHNQSPKATYVHGDISTQFCCEGFNKNLKIEMETLCMDITKKALREAGYNGDFPTFE